VAPSLDTLLRTAAQRSPLLAAARARAAAAGSRVTPAGALPDPSFAVRFDDAAFPRYTLGKDDFSVLGLEVQQGLPNPQKRRAARATAAADAGVVEIARVALERQVAAGVATLYARLYAVDQEIATYSASRELLQLLEATASSRYATGGSGLEGLVRAQLESLHTTARLETLAGERAALVAALNRELDLPSTTPLGAIGALPPAPPPPPDAPFAARANAPAVAAARAGVRAAERRVEAARLAARPDFSAGGGFGYRGGFDPIVTLRFGVDLPLRHRQKQDLLAAAAEEELEAARQELRAADAEVAAEVARWTAAWRTADLLVTHYREGLLPQTSVALDAARNSYLAGRADFSAVIEAFGLWLTSRTELTRSEAERFAAGAELVALIAPLAGTLEGTEAAGASR
jgi:outer membrane protein TolC